MTGLLSLLASVAAIMVPGSPPSVQCVSAARFNIVAQEPASAKWWLGLAGAYRNSTNSVFLTANVCTALSTAPALTECPVANVSPDPCLAPAIALFTIAHEFGHANEGLDESVADCYAASAFRRVLRLFNVQRPVFNGLILRAIHYGGNAQTDVPSRCWWPSLP